MMIVYASIDSFGRSAEITDHHIGSFGALLSPGQEVTLAWGKKGFVEVIDTRIRTGNPATGSDSYVVARIQTDPVNGRSGM
jgi:hypothetical protein